jgi:hypothetical protein
VTDLLPTTHASAPLVGVDHATCDSVTKIVLTAYHADGTIAGMEVYTVAEWLEAGRTLPELPA